MERNRRPPDVEEALSSMLWTPYQRTPTDSSDDDTPVPARIPRARPQIIATTTSNVPDVGGYVGESGMATDRHMYPKPIRYGFISNYFQFLPKSYNSRQLPSYESIENERTSQNFMANGSTGIYLLPTYTKYSSAMVHSFTDDFIQYQVGSATTAGLQSMIPSGEEQAADRSLNRFSNDFSTLNIQFMQTSSQWNNSGNAGDLHSMPLPYQYHNHQQKQSDRGTATTTNAATGNAFADASLPAVAAASSCRVTKPGGQHQWQAATTSRGTNAAALATAIATGEPLSDSALDREKHSASYEWLRAQQALTHGQLPGTTNAQTTTDFSRDRFVDVSVSSSAHVVHDLTSFVRTSCSSSESRYRRSWTDSINNNMRLNVPAAPEGGNATMPLMDGEAPTVSAVNGPIIGAMVPSQSSLTIQVNQNDPNGGGQQQDVVNQSSGISIVNCYRAVPVQIVNSENNTSMANNVQIVNNNNHHPNMNMIKSREKCDIQLNGKDFDDQIINVSNGEIQCEMQQQQQLDNQAEIENGLNVQRTFISTEAQTDDLQQEFQQAEQPIGGGSQKMQGCGGNGRASDGHRRNSASAIGHGSQNETENLISRDQRRRERRERRHANRARQQHLHPQLMQSTSIRANCEIIPDILHSHVPPPYTTLPMPSHCSAAAPVGLPSPPVLIPNPSLISPLPVGIGDDGRFTFPLPIMRRSPSERSGKGCCGQWFAGPPLRAVIAVVALGGVACALGGAALGATSLAGPPSSHLTAALLMIGVGVILVTVSGAAWRMTAPGAPQCLGLGTGELGRCGRRPCSGRAPHGLLYPEFQHRPPPPSYQASMQEYRLRLLLLDRDRQAGVVRASPPPTYRSHAGTLLRAPLSVRCNSNVNAAGPGSEYSLPPSYRPRNNLARIPSVMAGTGSGHTGDNSTTNMIMSNANESACMATITETRAIITSANQQHQLLQQQLQQQHQKQLLQQNSINSDTTATMLPANTVTSHSATKAAATTTNAIPVADDDVNNTKISHICSMESGGMLPMATEAPMSDIGRLLLDTGATVTDKITANGNGVVVDDESTKGRKDLVTIVTISGCTSPIDSNGEMDILAHL